MRIEYEENKTPFPDIPMYSSFIWENGCGENFLCVKTDNSEAICLERRTRWNFGLDDVVIPCEITKVSVRRN